MFSQLVQWDVECARDVSLFILARRTDIDDGHQTVARALQEFRGRHRLQELQHQIHSNYWSLDPPSAEAIEFEPLVARNLWRTIRNRPPESQLAAIESQAGCRTPAMFHQLCARSLELGEIMTDLVDRLTSPGEGEPSPES